MDAPTKAPEAKTGGKGKRICVACGWGNAKVAESCANCGRRDSI